MKNQWVTFFRGTVYVKVEGKGIERFINQLTRSNLIIWNVKRQGTMAVTFYIGLNDIHQLRKHVRHFDCRIHFLRGQGAPFLWKRTLKNAGFLLGFFLFFIIITLLSNMIWGVDIKGASPKTEHQIRKELDKLGVRVGNFQFFMDNVETIQHKLTNEVPNVTWIGVNLQGTTYHFQVVEKNTPKKNKKLAPQHLVANQKAVIEDMYVEQGKPVVKIHQYVKKGQLLVSGIIGNDKEKYPVAAKGKVYGETWYKSNVELPLKSDFQVYTGNEQRKHEIKIGKFRIPVWGFGKVTYKKYDKAEVEHYIRFLKWTLPIQYVETTFRKKEEVHREYTKQEAINKAKLLGKSDLKTKIPNDAKIKDDYVLQEHVDNGTLKLSIYFQVIENIAKAKRIPQGDLE
ncbi:sporulation protein YqfD [Heyndrickxia ginsengihumi]|uniref:Sporulation protein YqfD n=1 Tax=Heyndrickxia ginsengihumi TaxID=363870 RepID=A0A0A6XYH8_9BACI|nr:sporulation protein YqfD [Heyndrickxia ginsengihumi]KHD85197.1 stage IV sporulation protein [Heyndrickxia ginsengihumi]MBE6183962.1 sporulation protein YqfD [Bacillus sp. (in: firmicutes)]MCM3021768.1 sporulation protein YqfD [Heyndrickxia ginsengihumi]NEY19701.1 sporulation protein YqfD [Heyndrickxia ginsengihumi]